MPIVPHLGMGPYGSTHARPVKKSDILKAQAETQSGHQAAKVLGITYKTYKKYAEMYGIFDSHKAASPKGIKKRKFKGEFGLDAIFEGKHPDYSMTKLKHRIIGAGLKSVQCELCGFKEGRILDGRVPLVLVKKDGNKDNYSFDNLQLRCYNCTYLTTGVLRYAREEGEITAAEEYQASIDRTEIIKDSEMNEEEMEKLRKELMGF